MASKWPVLYEIQDLRRVIRVRAAAPSTNRMKLGVANFLETNGETSALPSLAGSGELHWPHGAGAGAIPTGRACKVLPAAANERSSDLACSGLSNRTSRRPLLGRP